MGRHGNGAEPRHDDGERHEPNAQKRLFRQGARPDVGNRLDRRAVEPDLFHFPDTDEIIPMEHGEDAHGAAADRPDDRRHRRPGHAEGREPEMPADEQIIEQHVDDVRHQIGGQGNAGVACPPLCGVDDHGHDVEHHAAHDNAEIGHSRSVGIGLRPRQTENRIRKRHAQRAHHDQQPPRDQQGLHQHLVGALPVVFTLPPSHNGGNCHVQRDKHRKADEFRLGGQADRGDGIQAEGTDHEGIHQPDQADQKGFHDGRPCHVNGI